jgi:hypothetical protein
MRFQPTVGDRPVHRRAILADIAARTPERMADRANRYPAGGIRLKPADDFKQLCQRKVRIGKGRVFSEFHFELLRAGVGTDHNRPTRQPLSI